MVINLNERMRPYNRKIEYIERKGYEIRNYRGR